MIRIQDVSTPVLILNSEGHGALGIARSLGRLGVPVFVAHFELGTPAFSSRYCRGRFLYQDPGFTQGLVDYLLSVSARIGRKAILIPTTDHGAIFVAEHAEALKQSFIFPDQQVELVRSLRDKREMYCLAKRLGIPTAETVFPASRRDLLDSIKAARFPVVLKGIDGTRLKERTGQKKTLFIVRNERELLQTYDAFEDPAAPNLMLQEYIPGSDDTIWMFNGYFNQRSECLFGLAGKKIRQCPVHRGVTSLGICLTNDFVEKTTIDFMKAIGYKGILDIGYRYDARDDVYKVLDINARIGATFRLFVTEDGMDVARALYLDLTGQRVNADAPRVGRKWMVEDLDLASCFRYMREGELSFKSWIGSLRGIQETAYFALDDPLPLGAICWTDARELLKRLLKTAPVAAPEGPAEYSRSRSDPAQT
jgi:D-aspartate ligase